MQAKFLFKGAINEYYSDTADPTAEEKASRATVSIHLFAVL